MIVSINFLELLGWNVRDEEFFETLDLCRLVVNAYKHGEGDAFEKLRKDHPEFFKKNMLDIGLPDFLEHSDLAVNDNHIDIFSNAIVTFWQRVPDQIRQSNGPRFPDWLTTAIEKDKLTGTQK